MRITVVGAAGFIGRHLVSHLTEAGHVAVGLDIVDAPGVRAFDAVRDAPDLTGTDAVVYLSQSPNYRDFPVGGEDLFGVNAIGPMRLARAARDASVRFFAYASTGSVYAPSFAPMDEDAPVRRDDAYALSKLTGEDALALIRSDDMGTLAMRFFGVFGPGQRAMLVPAIAARVRDGKPITVEPNPSDPADQDGLRISLTYVDDAVAAIRALCERGVAGEAMPTVLNVAAPEAVSIRELGVRLADELGAEASFEVSDTARRSDFIADVGRLTDLVEPRFTDFGSAIARTARGS